jgi:serine/threonine protein kinase
MSRATCPTPEQLSGYVEGALPPDVAETVAAHLETCSDCEDTLASIEQQGNPLLDDLRQPDPLRSELESPEYRRAIEAAEAAGGDCPDFRGHGGEAVAAKMGLSPLTPEGAGGDCPNFRVSENGTVPFDQPAHFQPRRLGEYELLAELGKGGMGAVYKARQVRLGKIVALKVLPHDRTSDPRAVARFEREMKAIGQLSHPNIVQALDARDIDGTTVLVMEYVDGLDLAKLISSFSRAPKGSGLLCSPCDITPLTHNSPRHLLRIADACELVRQAAVGLQCIHENGLVHRDIKPSNLMLTPQGQVKILDLGLALLHGKGVGSLLPERPSGCFAQKTPDPFSEELTSDGLAMGTPDYIAPEQAGDSHTVDIRADIYSLGCTLYHLLTGRAPFSAPKYKTPFDKVVAHTRDTAPAIRTLRPEIPDELSAIIERMMAKDPADRFAAPGDVAAVFVSFAGGADLAALLAHAAGDRRSGAASLPADGVAPRPSRRRKRWAVAVALVMLAIGFGLAIVIRIQIEIKNTPIPPPPERKPLIGWRSLRCDLGKTSFYPWASRHRTTQVLKPYTWRAAEPVDSVTAVLTGDINGDGRLEIVTVEGNTVAAYDAWGKELWRQNPIADSGVYIPTRRVGCISRPVLEDFDQNGAAEVLIVAGSRILNHGTEKGPLSIVAYDGQGKVARDFTAIEGEVGSVEPAYDFNGDGCPDVVFATGAYLHPHAICIYDYKTGGVLWRADFADIPILGGVGATGRKDRDIFVTVAYASHRDPPVGDYDSRHCYAVLFDAQGHRLWKQEYEHSLDGSMADLDGDGKDELVLINTTDEVARLHLIDPKDGKPTATLDGLQSGAHREWSIADVNGDGRKEIVFGDGKKLHVVDSKAKVLRSKDAAETQVMATNDLNGDGAVEIIARQGRNLIVFDGRLAEIARYRAAGNIQSAIVSDLDGDGINEVLFRAGEGEKFRLEIVHFEPDVMRGPWSGLDERRGKRF